MSDKDPKTTGFFRDDSETSAPVEPTIDPIEWTASEFIHHEKGTQWYLILGAGAVLVAGLVYLITNDLISTITIIIITAIFGFLAGRKPQVTSYRIDSSGVTLGNKSYPWGAFKSFAVMEESGIASIYLTPLKRFTPPAGMYFDPKDEELIVKAIGSYLPKVEREHDSIDKLMHKIRF